MVVRSQMEWRGKIELMREARVEGEMEFMVE